jgi:hypothetical protein
MRRRDVLAGAAGLAVLPAMGWAAGSATRRIALYDSRWPEALRFAQTLQRCGALAFDIRGDLATLWYGPLRQAFEGGRSFRIVGLASWADLVVAQGLAAEAHLRLTRQAIHDLSGPSHRILRSDDPALAARLCAAGAAWPEVLAGGQRPTSPQTSCRTGTLASWTINPSPRTAGRGRGPLGAAEWEGEGLA